MVRGKLETSQVENAQLEWTKTQYCTCTHASIAQYSMSYMIGKLSNTIESNTLMHSTIKEIAALITKHPNKSELQAAQSCSQLDPTSDQ